MFIRTAKTALARFGISPIRHLQKTRGMTVLRGLWPVKTRFDLVRLGGDRDGAYLVPDDLDGIEALFSPGVNEVADFEQDMAARGVKCFLADASVAGPPTSHPQFHFIPKYLGLMNSDKFITLDKWVAESAPGKSDLILQMDIENAEWTVLASVSEELLNRFRIIVLELHGLERILDFPTCADVLERLQSTHHVVHSHPNNMLPLYRVGADAIPPLLEITFLRKDRSQALGFLKQFPHELDIVNVPENPVVVLPPLLHA